MPITQLFSDLFDSSITDTTTSNPITLQEIVNRANPSEKVPSRLKYPLSEERADNFLLFKASEYVSLNNLAPTSGTINNTASLKTKEDKAFMLLPVPDSVTSNFSLDWSIIEGKLETKLEDLTSPLAVAKELVKESFASKSSELISNVAKKSQGTHGVAINPRQGLAFNNPGFRTFQFDFKFYPKSRKEAVEVLAIIHSFRYWSAPGEISIKTAQSLLKGKVDKKTVDEYARRSFTSVPAIWDVEFKRELRKNNDTTTNQTMFKVGPAAITNVNVQYNSTSWTTFEDGSPTEMIMTINLTELETINKTKIKQGY